MPKVGLELIALYDEYSSYLASRSAGAFRSGNPLIRVIEDRVVIDAVASGKTSALREDLVALGLQGAVAFGRVISGQLPISAIPDMAALSSLNSARAAAAMVHGGQGPLSPGKPNL